MKALPTTLFIALTSLTSNALAEQSNTYAGFQFAVANYKESGFATLKPTALVGRFGYLINNAISVEGRFGTGLQADRTKVLTTDVSFEVDSFAGAYLLAHLNLSPTVSIYGLGGYTSGKMTADGGFFSASGSDSSASYGIGADIGKDGVTFNIEYTVYIDETAYEVSAFSAGMRFAL